MYDSKENTDLYLSDIYVESETSLIYPNLFRFEFSLSSENFNPEKDTVDQDGDLLIKRRNKSYIFLIDTQMETSLDNVGLQLWRASFYLADFLMNNSSLIKGAKVVDLGAGLGITTLVASLFAEKVYCTDLEHVVKTAQNNFDKNKEIIQEINQNADVTCKALNWTHYNDFIDCKCPEEFRLTQTDLLNFQQSTVYLAADVIYDNTITLYFMNTVYKLLADFDGDDSITTKCCYISNEKRINFNVSGLAVADTAFDFFRECINDLDGYIDVEKQVGFMVSEVQCENLTQFVSNYKRNEYLTIWKVEAVRI